MEEPKLPPLESTPTILIRFTPKATPTLIELIESHLKAWNLHVVAREEHYVKQQKQKLQAGIGGVAPKSKEVILGLTTTVAELEHEAEVRRYVKPTKQGMMDVFSQEDREEFAGVDEVGFFSLAERGQLVEGLFDCVSIWSKEDVHTTNSNTTKRTSALVQELQSLGVSLSSDDNAAPGAANPPLTLRQVLQQHAFMDVLCPAHHPPTRDYILTQIINLTSPMPVQAIRDYYGEEVAFYFAWMDLWTLWLLLPGIASLAIYITRQYLGTTVDTCKITPFFGVGMFVWSICFLKSWRRQECTWAYHWGTLAEKGYIQRHFQTRHGFQGVLRTCPITGRLERYYPTRKRALKCLLSGIITIILLTGAFLVMIVSLNLQGYVHPNHDVIRWNEDNIHPFYIPYFASLAEEGHVFDVNTYRSFIPVVLHVIAIMTMNSWYRSIAEHLTEWENFETEVDHQNSLILKRFCFEAFDAYIALFYLAFFERDMAKLRGELVSMFNIDMFRRFLLEYIVPELSMQFSKKQKRNEIARQKKLDPSSTSKEEGTLGPLGIETDLSEKELYDDYLEMVIEFGYMTLFASAYPRASLIAIVAHMLELRSDALQWTRLCRKTSSVRTSTMGMWNYLLSSLVWMSALTNCLIFAYTSQQMMQYLPRYFYIAEDGDQEIVEEKEWIVVFLVFGMERVLVLFGLVVMFGVSSVPGEVETRVEHQAELRRREARGLRHLHRKNSQKKEAKEKENEEKDEKGGWYT